MGRTSRGCTTSRTRRPRREVLVRVSAVGLCGSDRHWLLEGGIGDAWLEHPLCSGTSSRASSSQADARANALPSIPPFRAARAISARPGSSTFVRQCGSPATARPTAPCAPSSRGRAPPASGARDAHRRRGRARGAARRGTARVRPRACPSRRRRRRLRLRAARPPPRAAPALAGASPIVATDVLAHRVAAAEELGRRMRSRR